MKKRYDRISYTQTDENKSSLPQKLVIDGSKIIINDFSGGRTFIFGLCTG